MNKYQPELLLAFLCLALYWQTYNFDFAYDDMISIVNHPVVSSSERSFSSIFAGLTAANPGKTLFRPIAMLSYRINFLLSGPGGFHMTNMVLHFSVALLLFHCVLPLLQSRKLALVTASIFAVHPVNVEAVANIIGRAEILAAFFGIISMICFRKFLESADRALKIAYLIFSGLSFFFAACSKESGYVLIILIPLYALSTAPGGLTRFRGKQLLAGCTALATSAGLALALRAHSLGKNFVRDFRSEFYDAANPLSNLEFYDRLLPAFQILGRYISLLILPVNLSADYSMIHEDFWALLHSLPGYCYFFVFAALLVFLVTFRRERFALLGLWFLIGFGLTANILTVTGTITGERLAYFPGIGLIGFVVALFARLAGKYKIHGATVSILAACLVLVFFCKSYMRIPVWKDNDALFSQTVRDAPRNPKAMFNYALHLYNSGGDLAQSQQYFLNAFELMPTNILTTIFLMNIALDTNKPSAAERWARKSLELDPNQPDVVRVLESLRARH